MRRSTAVLSVGVAAAALAVGALAIVNGGRMPTGSGPDWSTTPPSAALLQPTSLRVVCTHDDTLVDRTEVVATPYGLPLLIDDRTGDGLVVAIKPPPSEGDRHRYLSQSAFVTVPPGPLLLACEDHDGPEHLVEVQHRREAKEVVLMDANGHWLSNELNCSGGTTGGYFENWRMPGELPAWRRDPIALVRHEFDEWPFGSQRSGPFLRPSDRVEPAGWAGRPDRMRIVRDGRAIASMPVQQGPDGSWYIDTWTACELP